MPHGRKAEKLIPTCGTQFVRYVVVREREMLKKRY